MNRKARLISNQVTPEVNKTKIEIKKNGVRNRISHDPSVEKRKHKKNMIQAVGLNHWMKDLSRLRKRQATSIQQSAFSALTPAPLSVGEGG